MFIVLFKYVTGNLFLPYVPSYDTFNDSCTISAKCFRGSGPNIVGRATIISSPMPTIKSALRPKALRKRLKCSTITRFLCSNNVLTNSAISHICIKPVRKRMSKWNDEASLISPNAMESRIERILRGLIMSSSLVSSKPGNIPFMSEDLPEPASPTIPMRRSVYRRWR